MSIKCPFCGEHEMMYSNMSCPKYTRQLNEKYFVMLKFTELENRIKELENNNDNKNIDKRDTVLRE